MTKQVVPRCRFHSDTECVQRILGYKKDREGNQRPRYYWSCPTCDSYHGPVKYPDE